MVGLRIFVKDNYFTLTLYCMTVILCFYGSVVLTCLHYPMSKVINVLWTYIKILKMFF